MQKIILRLLTTELYPNDCTQLLRATRVVTRAAVNLDACHLESLAELEPLPRFYRNEDFSRLRRPIRMDIYTIETDAILKRLRCIT